MAWRPPEPRSPSSAVSPSGHPSRKAGTVAVRELTPRSNEPRVRDWVVDRCRRRRTRARASAQRRWVAPGLRRVGRRVQAGRPQSEPGIGKLAALALVRAFAHLRPGLPGGANRGHGSSMLRSSRPHAASSASRHVVAPPRSSVHVRTCGTAGIGSSVGASRLLRTRPPPVGEQRDCARATRRVGRAQSNAALPSKLGRGTRAARAGDGRRARRSAASAGRTRCSARASRSLRPPASAACRSGQAERVPSWSRRFRMAAPGLREATCRQDEAEWARLMARGRPAARAACALTSMSGGAAHDTSPARACRAGRTSARARWSLGAASSR